MRPIWPTAGLHSYRCNACGSTPIARIQVANALVEHSERGPVGVHRTYLRPDRSGKAAVETAKASLGPIAGGAVRGEKRRADRVPRLPTPKP